MPRTRIPRSGARCGPPGRAVRRWAATGRGGRARRRGLRRPDRRARDPLREGPTPACRLRDENGSRAGPTTSIAAIPNAPSGAASASSSASVTASRSSPSPPRRNVTGIFEVVGRKAASTRRGRPGVECVREVRATGKARTRRTADGRRHARRNVAGVILHSDRGCQYTAAEFRTLCAAHGVQQSMGKTGVCWDNARAASFFATYKLGADRARILVAAPPRPHGEVHWLEAVCNRQRRHSALDMLSPVNYAERYWERRAAGSTQVCPRPGQDHNPVGDCCIAVPASRLSARSALSAAYLPICSGF
jgi:transposase InsO family protein